MKRKLTDVEQKIVRQMDGIWQNIGPDCLGPEENFPSISGASVREIVLDQFESWWDMSYHRLDDDAREYWKNCSRTRKYALAKEAFPYRTYGW